MTLTIRVTTDSSRARAFTSLRGDETVPLLVIVFVTSMLGKSADDVTTNHGRAGGAAFGCHTLARCRANSRRMGGFRGLSPQGGDTVVTGPKRPVTCDDACASSLPAAGAPGEAWLATPRTGYYLWQSCHR